MESSPRTTATQMLVRVKRGDASAVADLMPLVYSELHDLAEVYLRRERSDHTLQPTALVHEAFLRLVDANGLDKLDRAHFLAISANVMRRVLVEHARAKQAGKRGGGAARVTLHSSVAIALDANLEILALDEAIQKLAGLDERQAKVVELRFFGGLTVDEVADVLAMSKRSVEADWTLARAWLRRELLEE